MKPASKQPGDGEILAVILTLAIAVAAWMFYLFLLLLQQPKGPCK